MRLALVPLLLILAACPSPEEPGFPRAGAADDDDSAPPAPPPDEDEDSWQTPLDCDDHDALVWPGAPELCDGVDNDCDDAIDEEVVDINWYLDEDGDGYGQTNDSLASCERLDGRSHRPGDCDDTRASIHPGARIDGIDADCDGRIEWRVRIVVSVDDAYRLCVDDEDNILRQGDDWTDAETIDVWLDSGPHVVGVYGYDRDQWVTGLLAHIAISDGTFWLTNSQWSYDPDPRLSETTRVGWCSPLFDDSAWQPAWTYGTWGTPPWEGGPPELEFSPSNWIWDDRTIDNETQYFRRLIVLP